MFVYGFNLFVKTRYFLSVLVWNEMEICKDLNRLIYKFVEPNFGSIVDAWLTHALHTKSKARFAREMRLHIPERNILWLDLYVASRNRKTARIDIFVTKWIGDNRRNREIHDFHLTYHHYTATDYERKHSPVTVDADRVVNLVGNGLKKTTPVDLGFGHWNEFWKKPKEKAILGIPEEGAKEAVVNTSFRCNMA